MSSAYLRLFIFLPAILIPACASSRLAFCMMHSACKLNKQGDNIQPWCTPFPIWKQPIVSSPVLTVASWPAYRFPRRQVRWSGIHISWQIFQFVVIHTKTFSSVQFSHSVVSDSLRSHESQHARPPCPSQTPGVYSNSCPSSQWCHPAISSSVIPFSSSPQSFPASGSFPTSQVFTWGGQSTGVSASASVQGHPGHPGLISFRMDWLDLLAVQGTLKSLLQHHSSKTSIFRCSAFFTVQLSHLYMTTGKTIALTRQTVVGKVMSLLFNMLSRLVITFLPRSKF